MPDEQVLISSLFAVLRDGLLCGLDLYYN